MSGFPRCSNRFSRPSQSQRHLNSCPRCRLRLPCSSVRSKTNSILRCRSIRRRRRK
ncbi:zinc finger domain-containing protein [Afipia sp. DC4300-2b1]|uniref:zinc finger domain-containing protein n=1 Tax=Afipia sp. DC4300-2b1 TaxID=2804672 RepID=UPI003CF1AC31